MSDDKSLQNSGFVTAEQGGLFKIAVKMFIEKGNLCQMVSPPFLVH